MVATSLSNIGDCRFEEAANGLEAIERLVLGPADLMILDLNMDKMNTDRLGSNGSAGQSTKKRSRQSRKNVKGVSPPQKDPGPSLSRTPFEVDENG